MGRRKRSQHGRLHGRNELIAEWIKQETGEKRDRKQISSHLQVLKKVFHDVPECTIMSSYNVLQRMLRIDRVLFDECGGRR